MSTQGQPSPPPASAQQQQQDETLTLSVSAQLVGRYPPPLTAIVTEEDVEEAHHLLPPTAPPGALIGLLTGKLDDFNKYAGAERSVWLLDVAHGICDPHNRRGVLRAYRPQSDCWTLVSPTDELLATSYLYCLPPGLPPLSLTRICPRERKSHTETVGNGTTMRTAVHNRDGKCWVTEILPRSSTNSHICPKRMGDALARRILEDFSGVSPTADSVYHPVFGVLLSHPLDRLFDNYHLGFRYRAQNVFECHDFVVPDPGEIITIYGSMSTSASAHPPILHGHTATPPNPNAKDLPPPALFFWHYVQCVVKRFKHQDYAAFANITLPVLVMRYESDSSDSGSSGDPGPCDWPTAVFDLARAAAADEEDARIRLDSVASWRATSAVVK